MTHRYATSTVRRLSHLILPGQAAPPDGDSDTAADDFDWSILNVRSHRPWAVPARPWLMTQTWSQLLFAHWRIDPRWLRRLVPRPFALDTFDGDAWLGIVPFWMTNVAPRAGRTMFRLPACAELNVRTYVRVGDKPGVYFFSLDAGSALAVGAARTLLSLPYHLADMRITPAEGTMRYRSVRSSDHAAAFEAVAEATGPAAAAPPGSLEYFLTERYCLYHLDRGGRPYRLEILHPPWRLQPARGEIHQSVAVANGLPAPGGEPVLHLAGRQDMVAWGPDRL
jgi:uncharacterized protein YqjF (DUF2071 family)